MYTGDPSMVTHTVMHSRSITQYADRLGNTRGDDPLKHTHVSHSSNNNNMYTESSSYTDYIHCVLVKVAISTYIFTF